MNRRANTGGGEEMKNLVGRFVTAKLKGIEDCRQGVCVAQSPDGLTIITESGERYECERATVVPLKGMWGETKRFAMRAGVRA